MKNFNENWDGIPRKNELDEAFIKNPTIPTIIQYVERAIEGNTKFKTTPQIMVQDLKNILAALKKIKK